MRKCRAIILGELFHVEQEARVSVDFMKIYPRIERGPRKEHPAIDFLTPSTRSLFPPVTILFYFPRARKKKKEAKERDGIEGEAASSSGESEIGRLHGCTRVHLVHRCYLSRIYQPRPMLPLIMQLANLPASPGKVRESACIAARFARKRAPALAASTFHSERCAIV